LPYYAAKRIQRYWRRYFERKHANDEPKKGVRHPKKIIEENLMPPNQFDHTKKFRISMNFSHVPQNCFKSVGDYKKH
jgi:hypothetical protein